MRHLPLLLLCTLVAVRICAQPALTHDQAASRISEQVSVFPQEKIYLHTDKDCYMAGDTLWFRAHVVDAASHAPVAISKYVYMEFRSNEKPASGEQAAEPLRLRILEKEGVYSGYIPFPMTAKSGEYTLCAYTLFMRNVGPDYFFRKNIRVGAYGRNYEPQDKQTQKQNAYNVSFYPEGGYLLVGQLCCVGFKALRGDGTSASISGVVRDDKGQEVVEFASLHAGMGKLFFTPQAGRTYTAVCTDDANNGRSFQLPEPQTKACILQVSPTSDRFTVNVAATDGYNTSELSLLIHCRGVVCVYSKWKGKHRSFAREDFPDGVLQLLLLDKAGNALSERLLFCYDAKRQPTVSILPDKPAYGRREKVTLTAEMRDAEGQPLTGSFSVAVTDNRMVDSYHPSDIRTTLLLESELRGYIEDPAYYFDAENPSQLAEVDALMLTQGWRRYDIPKVLQGQYAEPTEALEIGQEITGRIRKTGLFRKRNFKDYQVSMLAPSRSIMASALIDSAGHFALNGFNLPDGTLYVLRASGPDNKEDVELLIDDEQFPNTGAPVPLLDRTTLINRYNKNIGMFTDSLRNILLEEVVISAAARKVPRTPQEVLALKSFDYKEIEKGRYNTIEEALQGKHGVSIQQGYVYIFQKPAIFMIDGVIWEPLGLMDGLEDKIPVHIPMDFIKRIDIIPPVNSTLYGVRAKGCGLIYITTKTGKELLAGSRDDLDHLNIKTINPLGYQTPAEFYSPTYDTPKRWNAHERDLRTTLYWNPKMSIINNGSVVFEFYTTDEDADFSVHIEGMTYNQKTQSYNTL